MFTDSGAYPGRLVVRVAAVMLALLTGSPKVIAQNTAQAEKIVADFVWSEEFSAGTRILFSRYREGVWSKPGTVAENAGLNILPTIAAVGEDDMLTVWSTVTANGINLYYSRFFKEQQADNGEWSSPALLTAKRAVNLAPVLIAENGGYHVFWSAHEGSDDDIFSSKLSPGGWINPQQIHNDNAEVDALPEAGFDLDRRIWVRWESIGAKTADHRIQFYDTIDSSLNTANPENTGNSNSSAYANKAENAANSVPPDLTLLEEESRKLFDLEPPVFYRSKSRATMYIHNVTTHPVRLFPGNLLP